MSQSLKIGVPNAMMLGQRPQTWLRRIWKTAARPEASAAGLARGGAPRRAIEKAKAAGEGRKRRPNPLFVARDRGQSRHVLQQNSSPLQVENAVFPPLLQLPIDAFARRADEHPELLLRDVHFGTEVLRERAEPARQPHRQRLQHRFLHPLALPADALAQQLDDLDRDLGLALEMAEKILLPQHEQLRMLARGGVRRALLPVEHGNLAEEVARPHEIQRQPAAVRRSGLDADLAPTNPVQRLAGVALLKQHLAGCQMLGVAEMGNPLQLIRAQIREHRVHFQNDRKFGLLAHRNTFSLRKSSSAKILRCPEVCHKSHSFPVPPIIYEPFLSDLPCGINSWPSGARCTG